MWRLLKSILLLAVLGCLSGCSSSESSDFEEVDTNNWEEMEGYNEGDEYIGDDIGFSEYAFDAEGRMEGNVIIRPTCILLLKNDGTVVGKGDSSYGELGNGKRKVCENWTLVKNLGGVKKIYADYGVGVSNNDIEPKYNFCYALTESGVLYRWGGNILEPEEFLHDIKDIYDCGNHASEYGSCLMIQYDDGRIELIRGGGNNTIEIFDVTKIVKGDEILFAEFGYIIVKDVKKGISYYVDCENNKIKEIDELHSIYRAKCKEVARYKLGNNIESVGGECANYISVISEEGAVRNFVVKDHSVSFQGDWDGKGYKYYVKLYDGDNSFALYGNKVNTIGENEYGQLGDGTTIEYWDDWISIDEFECIELWAGNSDWGPYCTALDVNHNIWCWGGYFGSTPEIVELAAD